MSKLISYIQQLNNKLLTCHPVKLETVERLVFKSKYHTDIPPGFYRKRERSQHPVFFVDEQGLLWTPVPQHLSVLEAYFDYLSGDRDFPRLATLWHSGHLFPKKTQKELGNALLANVKKSVFKLDKKDDAN